MIKLTSFVLTLGIWITLAGSVQAFSLPDLGSIFGKSQPSGSTSPILPSFSTSVSGFGGISGLICQFLHILCPTTPNTKSNNTLSGNTPAGGGSNPTGGFSLPSLPSISTGITSGFPGISLDMVKQLWGDKPPLTWGGIGGKQPVPIPAPASNTNNQRGGANNQGPNSGGTSSTTGDFEKYCQDPMNSCDSNFETCNSTENKNQTLGCIQLNNSCLLSEKDAAFCRSKGYIPNGKVNPNPPSARPSIDTPNGNQPAEPLPDTPDQSQNTNQPIAGCINTSRDNFQVCVDACQANRSYCLERIKACKKGQASGGDCSTFSQGQQCCGIFGIFPQCKQLPSDFKAALCN